MFKTIHNFFWEWDYKKEEQWINDMSAKGYALVHTHLTRYAFEESQPSEYSYRIEYVGLKSDEKRSGYIAFVESTGAELVCESMGWVYFRKKTDDSSFELFSDKKSKIAHFKRISRTFIALAIIQTALVYPVLRFNFRYGLPFNLPYAALNILVVVIYTTGILKSISNISALEKDAEIFDE